MRLERHFIPARLKLEVPSMSTDLQGLEAWALRESGVLPSGIPIRLPRKSQSASLTRGLIATVASCPF